MCITITVYVLIYRTTNILEIVQVGTIFIAHVKCPNRHPPACELQLVPGTTKAKEMSLHKRRPQLRRTRCPLPPDLYWRHIIIADVKKLDKLTEQ